MKTLLLLALFVVGSFSFAQTTQPFAPGTPDVIIAVDDQPSTALLREGPNGAEVRVDLFARWKERGANTLYRNQKDEPREQWLARAAQYGFKAVVGPRYLANGNVDPAGIAEDEANPTIIGYTFEDEADRRQAAKVVTFARVKQIRDQIKAAGAVKPVMLTFTGGGGGFDNEYYNGTAAGQVSVGGPGHLAPNGWFGLPDVVAWDYYLNATGRPDAWFILDRMQDRAHEWSGGKPQLIYVESGFQNLEDKKRPGPTVAQYIGVMRSRVERARARGHNLKGFIIFPQKIGGGFQFDTTSRELADAMPAIHANVFNPFPPSTQPSTPSTQPSTRPSDPDLADVRTRIDVLRSETAAALEDIRAENARLKAQADANTRFLDAVRAAATQPSK